jgi:hypothetical protein
MIVTEEQAKTKWCPKVMIINLINGENVTNRCEMYPGKEDTCCIASDCMWWEFTGNVSTKSSPYEALGYCTLCQKK